MSVLKVCSVAVAHNKALGGEPLDDATEEPVEQQPEQLPEAELDVEAVAEADIQEENAETEDAE